MAEIKKIKVSSLLTGESDNISNSSYHANSAYDGGNSNVEEIDFNTREDGLKDFSNSKVQKKYPEFTMSLT